MASWPSAGAVRLNDVARIAAVRQLEQARRCTCRHDRRVAGRGPAFLPMQQGFTQRGGRRTRTVSSADCSDGTAPHAPDRRGIGSSRSYNIARRAARSVSESLPLVYRVEPMLPSLGNRDIRMSKPADLVQGTLDLLILKILALEPLNGFAIGQRLRQVSGRRAAGERRFALPALHKLEHRDGSPRSGSEATTTGARSSTRSRARSAPSREGGGAVGAAVGGHHRARAPEGGVTWTSNDCC